jgi:8-oxo-dGTP pyrophosphatase MutT (NUDIX family)
MDKATGATAPIKASLAATLVLVRDGACGLEVLMIVRHHGMAFASGAAVFPGGKVTQWDDDTRVAAIRETYEECGVLLAREAGGTTLLGRERLGALRLRWQQRIAQEGSGFADMVCEEGLELAVDLMQPFAHWVTPAAAPKRFDTHFFIAPAPAGQLAQHDGSEAVDAFWVRPADALDHCAQGTRTIMYPTLSNLALLAESADVASALSAARSRPLQRIQPTLTRRADGKLLPTLPPDAGYPALPDELLDRVAR